MLQEHESYSNTIMIIYQAEILSSFIVSIVCSRLIIYIHSSNIYRVEILRSLDLQNQLSYRSTSPSHSEFFRVRIISTVTVTASSALNFQHQSLSSTRSASCFQLPGRLSISLLTSILSPFSSNRARPGFRPPVLWYVLTNDLCMD